MKSVIVKDRQNIVDIVVQYYGSIAAQIDFCVDNDFELDHEVQAGDIVLIRDIYPDNADSIYADYIKTAGIVIVSVNEDDADALVLGTNNDEFIITNDDNFIGA